MNILTINLALSTLVFWIAAKLYVLPKLQDGTSSPMPKALVQMIRSHKWEALAHKPF
jgi:hypothetical protein